MAKQKPKKLPPPSEPAARELANVELPRVRWDVIGWIGLAIVAGWIFAVMLLPYVSYWGVGAMAVVTVAVGGFGLYAYNLTQKQARVLELLKKAGDAEGRKQALAELASGDAKDAMNALAKAQLEAREDPNAAIATLEAVDLAKAPDPVQDEVRAFLAQLYLFTGRPKDARPVTDALRLDRASSGKSRAMYAAVTAEALARTGGAEQAKKLLEDYRPDGDNAEVAPLLFRAQVFTYFGTKNRGLARKAMVALAASDPNMVAPFLVKGASADMITMAREVLAEVGYQTRPKAKVSRRM